MRRILLVLLACLAMAPAAFAEEKIIAFAAASLKTALDAAAGAFHAGGRRRGRDQLWRFARPGAPDRCGRAGRPVRFRRRGFDGRSRQGRGDPRGTAASICSAIASSSSRRKLRRIVELTLDRDAFANAIGRARSRPARSIRFLSGRYAKASLTKLGLWDMVEPHLAMTDNVRAALAFVARPKRRSASSTPPTPRPSRASRLSRSSPMIRTRRSPIRSRSRRLRTTRRRSRS